MNGVCSALPGQMCLMGYCCPTGGGLLNNIGAGSELGYRFGKYLLESGFRSVTCPSGQPASTPCVNNICTAGQACFSGYCCQLALGGSGKLIKLGVNHEFISAFLLVMGCSSGGSCTVAVTEGGSTSTSKSEHLEH